MIKNIHYCWLGSDVPPQVTAQVNNWEKMCPAYKLTLWNESNSNLEDYDFFKRMVQERRWGFASDIVSFTKIYEHGGFYLDCDVELKKNLDLLPAPEDHLVMGYMYDCAISGGVFYAPPKHPLLAKILEYYKDISPNYYPVNNTIITHCINNNVDDFKLNGRYYHSEKYKLTILPKEYLCQPSFLRNKPLAVDQFAGSWKDSGASFVTSRGEMSTYRIFRRKLSLLKSLYRNEFRNIYLAAQLGIKKQCTEHWRKEFALSGGAISGGAIKDS